MVVSITRSGYIKRLPLSTYRKQKRGGVGVIGMETKEDDYIEHLRICSTHDFLLFFTNYGQGLPAEGLRAARGRAHRQGPRAGQPAAAARGRARARRDRRRATSASTSTSCSAPSSGLIKKTELTAYNTPIRADGIIAIKLRDGDELVSVRGTERRGRHHHGRRARATRRASTRRGCGRWAATPPACGA